MTTPAARLAKLEAQLSAPADAHDPKAEAAKYGELLWTSATNGQRCYHRIDEDGLHRLAVLHNDGAEAVVYVSAHDPRGGQ